MEGTTTGPDEDTAVARAAYEAAVAQSGGLFEPFDAYRLAWRLPSLACWTVSDEPMTPPDVLIAKGTANHVFYGRHSGAIAEMHVTGSRNAVVIGPHCSVGPVIVHLPGNDGTIRVGAFTVMKRCVVQAFASSARVLIGERSLLSDGVIVTNSDTHGIYDVETGARINPDRDVYIGSRVFLGTDVRVGKGAEIGDGAMVLERSVVTGAIEAGGLYWGVPAALRRTGISWFHAEDVRDTLDASRAAEETRIGPLIRALNETIRQSRDSSG